MDDEDTPRLAGIETEETVEEEQADWAAFASLLKGKKNADAAVVVPFIPKRGDKDFEPIESLAAAQQNALKKSRNAMFAALQAGDSRQHQSKVHNEAVWHPDIARGSMKSTSGIHFQTMGHFHPARRRVELFPEEMLYLLERGTLECWTEEGVPMSAQQGFAWMLGQDELTMERYQVYAYLKRLGYTLMRASHGTRPPFPLQAPAALSPWTRLEHSLFSFFSLFLQPLQRLVALVKLCDPPRFSRRQGSLLTDVRWRTYKQAFEAIRVIPSGFEEPLSDPPIKPAENPFKVFWHVYKPITKIQKTQPPAPDFYVAVIEGARQGMPTVSQLADIVESLPTLPSKAQPVEPSWFLSLFRKKDNRPPRKPSPYGRLKTGEKMLVVAVVENGTSTFMKFGPSAFARNAWI